jgi:hypothetical protein
VNISQTDYLIIGAVALALAYTYRDVVMGWFGRPAAPSLGPVKPGHADPLDQMMATLAAEAEMAKREQVKAEVRKAVYDRMASVPLATDITATPNPAAAQPSPKS